MQLLLTIFFGALLFAALALAIRSIAIWIGLSREDAYIKKVSRQRQLLFTSHTRDDIEAVGMFACQRAAAGATRELLQQDLESEGWPAQMVWQIVNDAPAAAATMAGILVASGATVQKCMTELQARLHFTPAVIRLALFCAVTTHPDSPAATELGGAVDYDWKYTSACTSLDASKRTA